jgi:hypothetical protein
MIPYKKILRDSHMQNHTKLWIKPVTLASLLWTMGISNVMAADVESAAASVFKKLKLAQQPAALAPVPQADPTPPATPEAPAANVLDEQEAGLPATVTLEADGSGIPPDSLEGPAGGEPDASAGTGDEGTDDGSA